MKTKKALRDYTPITPFRKKLPRPVNFCNWLMTSGEVNILKMLMKELRFATT